MPPLPEREHVLISESLSTEEHDEDACKLPGVRAAIRNRTRILLWDGIRKLCPGGHGLCRQLYRLESTDRHVPAGQPPVLVAGDQCRSLTAPAAHPHADVQVHLAQLLCVL